MGSSEAGEVLLYTIQLERESSGIRKGCGIRHASYHSSIQGGMADPSIPPSFIVGNSGEISPGVKPHLHSVVIHIKGRGAIQATTRVPITSKASGPSPNNSIC